MRDLDSTGKDGCRCVDATSVLASLAGGARSCRTSGAESGDDDGVMLAAGGPCVPYSYGSGGCLGHDLLHDPRCRRDGSGPSVNPPGYCSDSWCFVDARSCMRSSSEQVYRSYYFGEDVDLFYSYTTCGSYPQSREPIELQVEPKLRISAAVPDSSLGGFPFIYKSTPDGDPFASVGEEYYNNSIPYEGVLVNLLESLERKFEGDFDIEYTYGSKSSQLLYPGSRYTAAVKDIHDGLVDMAVGSFWVTGERLRLTPFTVPITYDRTVLVVKDSGETINEQVQKVLSPFDYWVWALILAVIIFTAGLAVWFSGLKISRHQEPKKKRIYARLALDQFLQMGTFFCSAGIEQDPGASLPHNLLMSGFSFFILIVVSAYVANLAAFLTRDINGYAGTVDEAVAAGYKICAHPALEQELRVAHPDADFVFSRSSNAFYGFWLEGYDAGKCTVLAMGELDTKSNMEFMNMLCDRKLKFTNSLFIENPVAFPVRPGLVSKLSYWLHEGEIYNGISLKSSQEAFDKAKGREAKCEVEISAKEQEASEYAKVTVANLSFPIILYLAFAVAAAIVQLHHLKSSKRGSSLAGRVSTLATRKPARKSDRASELPRSAQPPPQNASQKGTLDTKSGEAVALNSKYGEAVQPHENSNQAVLNDDFHDNCNGDPSDDKDCIEDTSDNTNNYAPDEEANNLSNGTENEDGSNSETSAAARLRMLVETGTLDEVLFYVKEVKECLEEMEKKKLS